MEHTIPTSRQKVSSKTSSSAPKYSWNGEISDVQVQPSLSKEEAEAKLRQAGAVFEPPQGLGVSRYDTVQLPSNDPVEDDWTHGVVTIPSRDEEQKAKDWIFWGVFDGHA